MREIKFRVWCMNKMEWERHQIHLTPSGAILDVDHNIVCKPESHIVQMFTGLKDCNDVPMFEDDIVLMSNPTYQIQCAIIKGVVVFNYYSFGIQTKSVELWKHYNVKPPEIDSINYLLHCSDKIIEVIGNVHENPELLKAD